MAFTVRLTIQAERDLKRLPREGALRVREGLTSLANERVPFERVKKLKGHDKTPLFSFRIGDYRVILTINNEMMVIFVIEIGDRSTVYRKY